MFFVVEILSCTSKKDATFASLLQMEDYPLALEANFLIFFVLLMFTQKMFSEFLLITKSHPINECRICGGMKATTNLNFKAKSFSNAKGR